MQGVGGLQADPGKVGGLALAVGEVGGLGLQGEGLQVGPLGLAGGSICSPKRAGVRGTAMSRSSAGRPRARAKRRRAMARSFSTVSRRRSVSARKTLARSSSALRPMPAWRRWLGDPQHLQGVLVRGLRPAEGGVGPLQGEVGGIGAKGDLLFAPAGRGRGRLGSLLRPVVAVADVGVEQGLLQGYLGFEIPGGAGMIVGGGAREKS